MALEGGEAGTYTRGIAVLKDGAGRSIAAERPTRIQRFPTTLTTIAWLRLAGIVPAVHVGVIAR